MNKRCAKCGLYKQKDQFHKQKGRKDGVNPYCKICVSEAHRKRHPQARQKKVICKRCNKSERIEKSSYCYECRKEVGRLNYHKKWDNIPNAPQHLFKDLTGQRYGRLLVIELEPQLKKGANRWKCVCDCGNYTSPLTAQLKSGMCKSCGCLQKDQARKFNTKHGMTNSDEFGIWYTMKRRCTDPKVKRYKNYGGRGIKVCDRWMESFENFYEDMGPRPSMLHSIERKETNGDYCPDNCYWATEEIQSRNKTNNVNITINGVTKLMIDWAKEYGVKEGLVRSRKASGWPLDESIFTTPKFKRK